MLRISLLRRPMRQANFLKKIFELTLRFYTGCRRPGFSIAWQEVPRARDAGTQTIAVTSSGREATHVSGQLRVRRQ
jgi:hypothetical protein